MTRGVNNKCSEKTTAGQVEGGRREGEVLWMASGVKSECLEGET
jgi:hypothetical protein